MSPRQFGKIDSSATWFCTSCPHKHAPTAPCPPSATWLVLHFCPHCNEAKSLYCFTHRDRHLPSGDAHHTPAAVPPDDAKQRAAGDAE